MVVLVAVLFLAGGPGLGIEPGTAAWWWSRPLWILVLLALLLPVALLLSPVERRARGDDAVIPSPLRQVSGATMIGLAIALLAMFGIRGGPFANIDVIAYVLLIAGAAASGCRAPSVR